MWILSCEGGKDNGGWWRMGCLLKMWVDCNGVIVWELGVRGLILEELESGDM